MKHETTRPFGRQRLTGPLILLFLCMGLFVTAMSKGVPPARNVLLVPFEQPVTYTDVSKECGDNVMGLSFTNISYCALRNAIEKTRHQEKGDSLISSMQIKADESGNGNPRLTVRFNGEVKVAVNRFPGFNVLMIDARRPTPELSQKHVLFSEASLLRS